MRVRQYADDDATLRELARARETAIGRAFLAALETKEREVRDEAWSRPKLNTEDVKRDFRYLCGLADGAHWVQDLIAAAETEMATGKGQ